MSSARPFKYASRLFTFSAPSALTSASAPAAPGNSASKRLLLSAMAALTPSSLLMVSWMRPEAPFSAPCAARGRVRAAGGLARGAVRSAGPGREGRPSAPRRGSAGRGRGPRG
jgi:hypothetical protein